MSTAKLLVKVTSTLWLLYFLSSVEKLGTIDSNNATDDRFVLAMYKNSTAIVRSSDCSEEEKSSTIKIAEEHLRIIQMENLFL